MERSSLTSHQYVVETHMLTLPGLIIGSNVTITLSEVNPFYERNQSVLMWLIHLLYSPICAIFFIGGMYQLSHCITSYGRQVNLVIVACVALETIGNLLRFINGIDMYDARLLLTYEFTRALFTAHLVCTLLSSLLMPMAIHDILRRSKNISTGSVGAFLPTVKIPFIIAASAILCLEAVNRLLIYTIRPTLTWFTFFVIGFYFIAYLSIGSYFYIQYLRFIRFLNEVHLGKKYGTRITILNHQIL